MVHKVLVVGATGFLGSKLLASDTRLINFQAFPKNLSKLPVDFAAFDSVVYLRAMSSPTQVQLFPSESDLINIVNTSDFIEDCIKREKNVIFASSDVVYGDTGFSIASENTELKPFGRYAFQKAFIDSKFHGYQNFLTLRFSLIVGEGSRLRNMLISENSPSIPDPVIRNPIGVRYVVDLIQKLVLANDWTLNLKVLNVGGSEAMSILELASLEADLLGLKRPNAMARTQIDIESRPQTVRICSNIAQDFAESTFKPH